MPSLDVVETCDQDEPRVAGLLAVHLVSQVLDEAYVIANAADESGQPWRYISMLKNLRCGKLGVAESEGIDFVESQGDNDAVNESTYTMQRDINVVATSTPEKADASNKPKSEVNLIGQGDEEFDLGQNELSKSTSTFINNLFDMSDVEHAVILCDETRVIERNVEEPYNKSENLNTDAMFKIMESYANTAFDIGYAKNRPSDETYIANKSASSPNESDYSLLADTFTSDLGNDGVCLINNEAAMVNENDNIKETTSDKENTHNISTEKVNPQEEIKDGTLDKNDVLFYENAYLTLNRDYEQGSDDETEQNILPDPKSMALQEVELITADSSDNLSTNRDPVEEERKQLAAVSGVSGVSRKSKSSLVSKCKSQGARLLSCLRWWWRRKTPGKRKDVRPKQESMRGICPLSPDARRRASSLLDNRELYSPVPSRAVAWKFNTVNEALVNSRWKDYSFEANPEECAEYY